MLVFPKRYPALFSAQPYKKDNLCAAQEFYLFCLQKIHRKLFLQVLALFFLEIHGNHYPAQNKFHSFHSFLPARDSQNQSPFGEFLFYGKCLKAKWYDLTDPAAIPIKHSFGLWFHPHLSL